MKLSKLCISLLVIGGLFLSSCATVELYTDSIQNAVAVATTTALAFGVKDPAKRTILANYLDVYAMGLRTITTNPPPTPQQLTNALNSFIPADVKAQYPEVVSMATPLIVSNYELVYAKLLKGNPKYGVEVLNSIATGIETGAANYVTKTPTAASARRHKA